MVRSRPDAGPFPAFGGQGVAGVAGAGDGELCSR